MTTAPTNSYLDSVNDNTKTSNNGAYETSDKVTGVKWDIQIDFADSLGTNAGTTCVENNNKCVMDDVK
jgi:hypothetical protein